ncbi:hypothetical protein N7535_009543 [Penicillium sp. DV-2018c]|nr:hypothetical protein N7461_002025 [Penicillium sp. DV-2018c]KAJ5559315.1 hypothetical protein N7535_009543 [Penicillium sp. DV-2018c]
MASKPESRIVRALKPKKKPNTAQAAALQKSGQNAYKLGDLQGAIASFTQALAANNEDVGILDNRAATYCKLKQYGPARADARAMIKLAPNDDRGYLRLAKVLCLDGNFDKARDIYEYALQKLSASHPGREVVTQLLNKLQDKLAGGNRRDPFTVLPLEMADIILRCFSFKQIAAILRVCKGWHRFLTGHPSIWMCIDLTGARSRVPWTTVRDYVRRSRAQLTYAAITNLVSSAIPRALDMLSRCPKLEHLEFQVYYDYPEDFCLKIQEFRHLKSLVCGPDIILSHARVGTILSTLTNLEKATFSNVRCKVSLPMSTWPRHLPNLKSLTLGSTSSVYCAVDLPDVVPGLGVSAYPNLEELRLFLDNAGIRSHIFDPVRGEDEKLPALRTLDLRRPQVQSDFFSILPVTLETLRVDWGYMQGGDTLTTSKNILPNLKTLIFNQCNWLDFNNIVSVILDSEAALETLHVNSCAFIHVRHFLETLSHSGAPNLKRVTELSVACMDLHDSDIPELLTALPNVRVLNLSQTKITGCTIRLLADAWYKGIGGAQPDVLIIKSCDDVSPDAIDYGRQMGLKIVT